MTDPTADVKKALQKFQDGYESRNLDMLDQFMDLFVRSDSVELIGIGATVRGGDEWFRGPDQIREIIASDWQFWGEVVLKVEEAQISVQGDTAWLSTSGELVQNETFDAAMGIYLNQMKDLLEDDTQDPGARLMEATHFGLRRLRERQKGSGYAWPLVITAVLLKTDGSWRFHTLHWSMPVD